MTGWAETQSIFKGKTSVQKQVYSLAHPKLGASTVLQESSPSLLGIRTEVFLLQGLPTACAQVVSKQVNCYKTHRELVNSLHGYRFWHQSNKMLKSSSSWITVLAPISCLGAELSITPSAPWHVCSFSANNVKYLVTDRVCQKGQLAFSEWDLMFDMLY